MNKTVLLTVTIYSAFLPCSNVVLILSTPFNTVAITRNLDHEQNFVLYFCQV